MFRKDIDRSLGDLGRIRSLGRQPFDEDSGLEGVVLLRPGCHAQDDPEVDFGWQGERGQERTVSRLNGEPSTASNTRV